MGDHVSPSNMYNPTVNTPYETQLYQLDGAESIPDSFSDVQSSVNQDNSSLVDADDEVAPENSPFIKTKRANPCRNRYKLSNACTLPLLAVTNARSVHNKSNSLKTFVSEIYVEVTIVSETCEREDLTLKDIIDLPNYKISSSAWPKQKASKQPAGGCAIIFNENRFKHVERYY